MEQNQLSYLKYGRLIPLCKLNLVGRSRARWGRCVATGVNCRSVSGAHGHIWRFKNDDDPILDFDRWSPENGLTLCPWVKEAFEEDWIGINPKANRPQDTYQSYTLFSEDLSY